MSPEQADEALRLLRAIRDALVRPSFAAVDPIVDRRPHAWRGEDFNGRPFSQTTPPFLAMLAISYEATAAKHGAAGRHGIAERDWTMAEGARAWRAILKTRARREARPSPTAPAAPGADEPSPDGEATAS